MALVQDILDRFRALASDRSPWDQKWREVAVYALPDADRFDVMFANGELSATAAVTNAVVGTPVAAERSPTIFDMTSLWAIDRMANGLMSLVTPQSSNWHDMASDDPFGGDPSDEEMLFYEGLRDYLFRTRGNPRSGFWTMHKAAIRCMCAFGTAVSFLEESTRGVSSPISYRFIPLSENYLGVSHEGTVNVNYRLFSLTARQAVAKYGTSVSSKTLTMANDPKDGDKSVQFIHAVQPREDAGSYSYGSDNRSAPWSSCVIEIDEKKLVGESGYWEFPFRVDHWQRNNPGPYSEGPMSLALAEVKSLNMLSKQELRAVQQWVDPPYATVATTERLNLNSRAPNPGFLTDGGDLLVKPIHLQERPDFAQTILQARREAVSKTLYVPLWSTILDSPRERTAYETMLLNQEKGDLIGPVGSSMQVGLSWMVDRETGILARKGAFEDGSPLAPPQSLRGKAIGVRFTSPLDRLRRLPQLQGMTQLWELAGRIAQSQVAAGQAPTVFDKLSADKTLDEAQEILGAPQKIMVADDEVAQVRSQRTNAANAKTAIDMTREGGEAAMAAGTGIDTIAQSPAATAVLKNIAGVAGVPA